MQIKIGDFIIGENNRPYIIAEMSGNHNKSLDRALEIVEQAAKAGADAIKLQTYTPDTMTLDIATNEFFISDENLWTGESLYNLYKEAYTPWEWHEQIFQRAKELGMSAFSSPFDLTAIDFLEKLDVPAYKIASFENVDIPLIKKAASTGKPIIISTGMASISEIEEAVKAVLSEGNEKLILLKCTSTYPASPRNSNLLTIPHMKSLFGVEVGLSDHTMGIGTAIAAVSVGATIIEKHFTISRSDGGVDSAFSLEPNELQTLVVETKRAWESLGGIQYGPSKGEIASLQYRRSLYITQDMEKGEVFTEKNVKIIRPGKGLQPKYIDLVLGKPIKRKVTKGTPLSWDLLI